MKIENEKHDLQLNVDILKDGRGKVKIRGLGRSFYATPAKLKALANMLLKAAKHLEE